MPKDPRGYSSPLQAALKGVRHMGVRLIDTAHRGDPDEKAERAKFRRLTEEQEGFQALHLAVAESVFRETGQPLTAEAIRAILVRLGGMGYEVKRAAH